MIAGKKFSVIVTNYRERGDLSAVLRAWLGQPVDEVILADCSGKWPTGLVDDMLRVDPRFKVVSFSYDFGTKTDYVLALLTDGDFVILADDDVLPKTGFVNDLYSGWKKVGGMIGVIGRVFHGPLYKGNTTFYSALKIKEPVQVGFIGVVYFAERSCFGFDVISLPNNNVDDLFWCMDKCRDVPKFVVPTLNFKNLPEASDKGCMFHSPVLREKRQKYYEEMYLKYYAPYGRSV